MTLFLHCFGGLRLIELSNFARSPQRPDLAKHAAAFSLDIRLYTGGLSYDTFQQVGLIKLPTFSSAPNFPVKRRPESYCKQV
jgi:hypothetical protein